MTDTKFNLDDGSPKHETIKRMLSEVIKQFLEMNNSTDHGIVGIPSIYYTKEDKYLAIWIPGNGVPGKNAVCKNITKSYIDSLSKHGD